tara:strand:- start:804 stop:1094 length:291 start_codon:yes stop_codon:yes gene_type:complete
MDDLEKLYELCKAGDFKLAFILANGQGVSSIDFLKALWDKFSKEYQNFTELYFNEDSELFFIAMDEWYCACHFDYSDSHPDKIALFNTFIEEIENG